MRVSERREGETRKKAFKLEFFAFLFHSVARATLGASNQGSRAHS